MTNHPLDLLVRKFTSHLAMSDADCSAVLALPHTLRRMSALSYLVREGEVPGACPVLLSGFAFRQKLTDEGARQIVSLHMPGEPVNLHHLYLDRADHNVQLMTEAQLAFVPRQALRDLARTNPTIANAMTLTTAIEASILREWVLNIGRRDARHRLAHLLCEFSIRLEYQNVAADHSYELPMSQEQLGDALGLTSVHVNRSIKTLETEGFITRTRRTIAFPDWAAMTDMAGFSDLYLHLGQQRPA